MYIRNLTADQIAEKESCSVEPLNFENQVSTNNASVSTAKQAYDILYFRVINVHKLP